MFFKFEWRSVARGTKVHGERNPFCFAHALVDATSQHRRRSCFVRKVLLLLRNGELHTLFLASLYFRCSSSFLCFAKNFIELTSRLLRALIQSCGLPTWTELQIISEATLSNNFSRKVGRSLITIIIRKRLQYN